MIGVLPVVATQNIHHADRAGSRLHDALVAIRHTEILDEARRLAGCPSTAMLICVARTRWPTSFARGPMRWPTPS